MSDQRMTPRENRDFERAALRGLADHLGRSVCVSRNLDTLKTIARTRSLSIRHFLSTASTGQRSTHESCTTTARPPLRRPPSATYDPYSPGSPSNIGYGCNSASMHLVGREGTPGANANVQP